MPRIAVEHPFTDIQLALSKKGYQADMFDQKEKAGKYDVIVVRNMESYDYLRFKGSLVEVSGRTVNEVVDEVEERLQRAGKIPGQPGAAKSESGNGFFAGLLSGAIIGSAAALLFAPKSGKEMQVTVKEKLASKNSGEDENGKLSQVKEKATDLANTAKEKATEATAQVKEKVSGSSKEEQETNSSSSEEKKN